MAVFFQGQPGTGKSTAVWRKVLQKAAGGDSILWVSLKRNGTSKSNVYFHGKCYMDLILRNNTLLAFIAYCMDHEDTFPLETIVVDGMSQMKEADELRSSVDFWLTAADPDQERRGIFTSSTKVEKGRSHQNDTVKYVVIHSWTEGGFYDAMVHQEKLTPLYTSYSHLLQESDLNEEEDSDEEQGATNDGEGMEIERDTKAGAKEQTMEPMAVEPNVDAQVLSVEQKEYIRLIVRDRFKYTGGSALWMFNYTNETIEQKCIEYCTSISNRSAVLSGEIGPTSKAATNFFFGSHKKDNGATEYFIVSQRAVEILREQTSASSFRTLYDYSRRLQSPAFTGWIVEADFFEQLNSFAKLGESVPLQPAKQRFLPAEKIVAFDHTKNRNRLATLRASATRAKTKNKVESKVKSIASNLIPNDPKSSIACKPLLWSQGGYDVFFIESPGAPDDKLRIQIRFGQVTKGASHTFKGGFIYSVIKFFEAAGYAVDSVGFTFILTAENMHHFELGSVEGEGFLSEYRLYDSDQKWDVNNFSHCLMKCTSKLSG